MSTLMIANPRRRRRRRRTMTAAQAKYFAPKRRRSSRRKSRSRTRTIVRYAGSPAPRRARRRRSGGGGLGLSLGGGGLVGTAKNVAVLGAAAAAGVVATPMILDRIPWVKDQTGYKRIGAMIGLAVLVARFGPRFIPRGLAGPIATGIAASAATTLYTNWKAGNTNTAPNASPLSGYGRPNGVAYFGLNPPRNVIRPSVYAAAVRN
ncbi:MAG: hypothetical protein JSS51_03985 [Planctomycetes bacterium]|nr:hypothetical protein [Planctomycetota bacterium]